MTQSNAYYFRRSARAALLVLMGVISGCTLSESETTQIKTIEAASTACAAELVVLGIGQDAGAPQIGNPNDPAWADPSQRLLATSLGLIDHENQKRYMFEATPDIREQVQFLDETFPGKPDNQKGGLGLDGIFLTHAHIGHYAGLMFLGRESAGTKNVPVYVLPRMGEFLSSNGPWSQLADLENIELKPLEDPFSFDAPVELSGNISVAAFKVPHRDEFSETAGYVITGPQKSVLFIPDIDGWAEWENLEGPDWVIHSDDIVIREFVRQVDYAFVDATFYDDNELPGRDMSQIPHPRVTETMDMIDAAKDETLREKIRFIHLNHTNPLRNKDSDAYKTLTTRGYKMARRGDRMCL